MEKIYLIESRYDYQDGTKQDWTPIYGVRDYQETVRDIKRMISEERENRKIRVEKYGKVLYKVYHKIHAINLY